MDRALELLRLAQALATETPGFFETKGPGAGNHATNAYVAELRIRATALFGANYAEQPICGDNRLCVDYYFPDEGTVVEVALGLFKPKTEYEKDVLKAIMAVEAGHRVDRLFFICKPNGIKKCAQPGRQAVADWVEQKYGIRVEVHDLDHV